MTFPKAVSDIYASGVESLFRKDKMPPILEADVPSVFVKIGAQSFTDEQKKQARTNIGAVTLTDIKTSLIPAGTLIPYAGKTLPAGWLLCNGAAVSRTTYADLFAAIGTTYGTGNGSTTFNLPNCNGRCIEGTTTTSEVGTLLDPSLPDIANHYHGWGYNNANNCGSFVGTSGYVSFPWISGTGTRGWNGSGGGGSFSSGTFNINMVTTGSTAATTTQRVQPSAIKTLMIIKF